MNFLYLFVLLLSHIFALANPFGGDGDLGLSVGSSAASKLVRNAVDGQLRQPRLMQIDVNSANDPWFNEVARFDSRNRIAIEKLEVNFRDRQQIEVQGNNLHLNSTTFINNAALPLWFLDQKSVLLHVEIKKAYLRLNIDQPAILRIEECEVEQGDVELALERSYLVNLLLKALHGTMMDDKMIKERVCGFLLDTAIDLREKYSLELPLKSVVPEKFTRYLIKDNIDLRSHIQSINAADDQITIAAVMEWTTNIVPSTERTHSSANSVRITDLFNVDDANNAANPNVQVQEEQTTKPLTRSTSSPQSSDHSSSIKERILLWAEVKFFNDIFKQFRWDFQWVNESIQFGSPKLPKETRDFFEVICPQCFFLFNVSADGVPDVQIREKSIIIRSRNRIAAAVLNPTIGPFGQKRTAIDLSMELQFKFVPEIQDGIFRTYLELLEHKVEVKTGSAFPSNMYKLVEQLIQDLIAEDIWPVLQRELKPLIYESGIPLPSSCGLDPKSMQIHFEQGRFGVSAHLFLDNWSNTTSCIQQFKSALPDTSKLFVNLPKEHNKKKRRG